MDNKFNLLASRRRYGPLAVGDEKLRDSEIWPRDPMTNAFRGLGELKGSRRSNKANAVCRHTTALACC